MDIYFKNKKLQRICTENKQCIKEFGAENAAKIQRRIKELRAFDNLALVPHHKPIRCHNLTGNRKGQYAVDVKHPYRLIFEPLEPVPRLEDGSIDKQIVTAIKILEVEDYHGK